MAIGIAGESNGNHPITQSINQSTNSYMHLLKIRHQLSQLHSLIQMKATGTPEQLAQRMGVTDRTVKCLIAQLRQMDADICYCHRRRTYYYRYPVCFKFGFELLDDNGKDDGNTKNGGG